MSELASIPNIDRVAVMGEPITEIIDDIVYGITPINTIKVSERTNGDVTKLIVDDTYEVVPTGRFWDSIATRFSGLGVNSRMYTLFSESEVFDRIVERSPGSIRYCIERRKKGVDNILAVSKRNGMFVPLTASVPTIARHVTDDADVSYYYGVLQSKHRPYLSDSVTIANSEYHHSYKLKIAVDGYGAPRIKMGITNVQTGCSIFPNRKLFTKSLVLGSSDDGEPDYNIERTLSTFNDEEAYAEMVQKLRDAAITTASLAECCDLFDIIMNHKHYSGFMIPPDDGTSIIHLYSKLRSESSNFGSTKEVTGMVHILRAFTHVTGDIFRTYNLHNHNEVSYNRKRVIPTKATVLDIIEIAAETSEKWVNNQNLRDRFDDFIGKLISDTYHLHGISFDTTGDVR